MAGAKPSGRSRRRGSNERGDLLWLGAGEGVIDDVEPATPCILTRSTGRRTGRLVVSDRTKTGRTAVLPLPAAVTTQLERHRREQLRERLAAPVWVDAGLVFTTGVGTALEPRNINRSGNSLCDQAGVRRVRVHDLRHTAASLLLAQGVDLEVVQTTLRHTRLSTTADIYTHVQADVQRAAADRMNDLLQGLPGLA